MSEQAENLEEEGIGSAGSFKPSTSLISGNVKIHHRRTSVRLEEEMWAALDEVAAIEKLSIHDLCSVAHDSKSDKGSFVSALRVFLLDYYRHQARGRGGFKPLLGRILAKH